MPLRGGDGPSPYIKNDPHGKAGILKKETIQTMLSAEHFGRGLCWDNYKLENDDLAWGHGGGDPGIKTRMIFRAKDGVGVILFFHCDQPGKAPQEIQKRLFDEAAKF